MYYCRWLSTDITALDHTTHNKHYYLASTLALLLLLICVEPTSQGSAVHECRTQRQTDENTELYSELTFQPLQL